MPHSQFLIIMFMIFFCNLQVHSFDLLGQVFTRLTSIDHWSRKAHYKASNPSMLGIRTKLQQIRSSPRMLCRHALEGDRSERETTKRLPILREIHSMPKLFEILSEIRSTDLSPREAAIAMNHVSRLLTVPMRAFANRPAVLDVMNRYQCRILEGMNDLDEKHISWGLNAAKRTSELGLHLLSTPLLFEAAAERLVQFDQITVQNLALILNAFAWQDFNITQATLGLKSRNVIEHLENMAIRLPEKAYLDSMQSLTMMLNSLVRLGREQSRLIPFLVNIFVLALPSSVNVHSLCLIAHAVSRIPVDVMGEKAYRRVFEAVSANVLRVSPSSLYPRAIATLSSSFARAQFTSSDFFQHLSRAAAVVDDASWETRAAANTMNAFSSVGHVDRNLMIQLAMAALNRYSTGEPMLPRHVVMILNALTRLDIISERIFRDFAALILRLQEGTNLAKEQSFTTKKKPRDLSERHDDPGNLQFWDANCSNMEWSALEIAAVAQAYASAEGTIASKHHIENASMWRGAKLKEQHPKWASEAHMSDVVERVLCYLAEEATRRQQEEWLGLNGMGQPAANMINALARVGLRHSTALEHLAGALAHLDISYRTGNGTADVGLDSESDEMNNLAQAVHGLASLNYPHSLLLRRVCEAVRTCEDGALYGQRLANIAWALAVLEPHLDEDMDIHGQMLRAVAHNMQSLLEGRETAHQSKVVARQSRVAGDRDPGSQQRVSFVDLQEVRQVHQYMVSRSLLRDERGRGLACRLDEVRQEHQALARSVFEARSRNRGAASKLQGEVAAALRSMGWRVAVEAVDPETGYSVDIELLGPVSPVQPSLAAAAPLGSPAGHPQRTAVEVDGPLHFARPGLRVPLGHTVLKRRHLQAAGWRLVAVPFWEWSALPSLDHRRAYLDARLRAVHVGERMAEPLG